MSLDEMIRTIINAGYEVRKNDAWRADKAANLPFFGVFMATKNECKVTQLITNLYSRPHKGQRFALFRLATRAGALNHGDKFALNAIHGNLAELKDEFHLHAELEEKFIHPLLYERVPGAAKGIEQDHLNMHIMLDELVNHFNGIMDRSNTFEKIDELCLEFYLALNRFISFYLAHIDKEEESIQPVLYYSLQ